MGLHSQMEANSYSREGMYSAVLCLATVPTIPYCFPWPSYSHVDYLPHLLQVFNLEAPAGEADRELRVSEQGHLMRHLKSGREL